MAANSTAPSVSETLAAWIEGLKATDIPEAARRAAEAVTAPIFAP